MANVTDASGATQWTYAYDPFGTEKTATNVSGTAPTNLLRFTGELLDPTGLYHLRARQYDPTTGRFTATDPVASPLTSAYTSAYAYVGNQPTVYIDPSGLCVFGAPCIDDAKRAVGQAWGAVSHAASETATFTYNAAATAGHYTYKIGYELSGIEDWKRCLGFDSAGNLTRAELKYQLVASAPGGSRWGSCAWAVVGSVGWGKALKYGYDAAKLAEGARAAKATDEAVGGVYSLRDDAGNVLRTGRTKDLARREGEHARDSNLGQYRFNPEYRTDNYAEQRGLEQLLHDEWLPPLNKIRPISPRNRNIDNYLQAGRDFRGGS